ncbi:hypothetical protein HYC85_007517 [Camellia sinensis]|uniref:Uncharacterized protein n=1 Tax=Camellia sinensis TaxID=4442 RepID=A0A7J7HR14_CAMSI|nr:hypothetical protein HYC85_007517 [Camellia sinensis]
MHDAKLSSKPIAMFETSLRYVEQELAKKRGKNVDVANQVENEVKHAEDELYKIPEHLKPPILADKLPSHEYDLLLCASRIATGPFFSLRMTEGRLRTYNIIFVCGAVRAV